MSPFDVIIELGKIGNQALDEAEKNIKKAKATLGGTK